MKEEVIDTLSTTMANVQLIFQEIQSNVVQSSETVQKELIEPMELYSKHYSSTNQELNKQATHYWNKLNRQRSDMLQSKEIYFQQMNVLNLIKRK